MKLYMFGTVPLSETCRVSYKNKYMKLVHLVGIIIKKHTIISANIFVISLGVVVNGCFFSIIVVVVR
jgi:hypothetical protein